MRNTVRRTTVLAVAVAGLLLGGCETRLPQVPDVYLARLPDIKLHFGQNELKVYKPRSADDGAGRDAPAKSEQQGAYVAFLTELGKYESGGLTRINYAQAGNQAGYIGGWQFGEAALIDAGFYTGDRTPRTNDWKGGWTGLKGVTSKQEFLANPDAQWHAIKTLMPLRWAALQNMGLLRFVGETVKGVSVTESGLLAASHLAGPGGVRDFLRSGGKVDPADANDTTASSYLGRFNGFETPYVQKAVLTVAVETGG